MAHSFYTSWALMEVLRVFSADGELAEDIEERLKYAKFKAYYILKCIREGVTPVPGLALVMMGRGGGGGLHPHSRLTHQKKN